MTREQMIAWLTLEGWEPLDVRPVRDATGFEYVRNVNTKMGAFYDQASRRWTAVNGGEYGYFGFGITPCPWDELGTTALSDFVAALE